MSQIVLSVQLMKIYIKKTYSKKRNLMIKYLHNKFFIYPKHTYLGYIIIDLIALSPHIVDYLPQNHYNGVER